MSYCLNIQLDQCFPILVLKAHWETLNKTIRKILAQFYQWNQHRQYGCPFSWFVKKSGTSVWLPSELKVCVCVCVCGLVGGWLCVCIIHVLQIYKSFKKIFTSFCTFYHIAKSFKLFLMSTLNNSITLKWLNDNKPIIYKSLEARKSVLSRSSLVVITIPVSLGRSARDLCTRIWGINLILSVINYLFNLQKTIKSVYFFCLFEHSDQGKQHSHQ